MNMNTGQFVQTVAAAAGLALSVGVAMGDARSYDGSGNNVANPTWGAAGTRLVRRSPAAYADGLSGMARQASPNPRDLSNIIASQTVSYQNSRGLSDMVWQWGQFVDHDIDLTKLGTETASIATSPSDPAFAGTPIGFSRSVYDASTGGSAPREQMNSITSYLDGSQIYGSDAARASALRSHVGGRMLVQSNPTGDLLPLNSMNVDMGAMPGSDATQVYAAGDGRANEQPCLTAMHTLFVREHNRLADQLAAANPSWNDEQIFQTARKIVGAEIQKITYQDWLPHLIGLGRLHAYTGYRPNVDAGIATEFSTAAFRIGHTMLNGTLLRLGEDGNSIPQGPLTLRNHFFAPSEIPNGGGISPMLRGLVAQPAQEIDLHVIDDVREFLAGPFGPPGFIGFDLVSLNIQRGRDHGLCDYNSMRVAYGLSPITSFSQITSDPYAAGALQGMYGSVSAIDPWVGMIAEDHLPGTSAGPLMTAVLVDQFERTRDGDRFWYEIDPDMSPYRAAVNATTLADIIKRNTDIVNIQPDVFYVPQHVCRPDFNGSGSLDTQDIFDFIGAWFAGDARADYNGVDGVEITDIFAYLNAWFQGC
jgi:hypothetical protein